MLSRKEQIKEINYLYENELLEFMGMKYDESYCNRCIRSLYNDNESHMMNYPVIINCNEEQWDKLRATLYEYLETKNASTWDDFTNAYNEVAYESETNRETYYWDIIKGLLDDLTIDPSDNDTIQELIETYKKFNRNI